MLVLASFCRFFNLALLVLSPLYERMEWQRHMAFNPTQKFINPDWMGNQLLLYSWWYRDLSHIWSLQSPPSLSCLQCSLGKTKHIKQSHHHHHCNLVTLAWVLRLIGKGRKNPIDNVRFHPAENRRTKTLLVFKAGFYHDCHASQ